MYFFAFGNGRQLAAAPKISILLKTDFVIMYIMYNSGNCDWFTKQSNHIEIIEVKALKF